MARMHRFHGLRFKVTLTVLVGALIFSTVIILVVFNYLNKILTESLIYQGEIVGNNLSELVAEKLITEDRVGLIRIVEKYRMYPNIEYILVEDFNQNIQADTYQGQVPPDLIRAHLYNSEFRNKLDVKTLEFQTQKESTSQVYDLLVPVKEGLLGFVRVGMKKTYVDSQIKKTLFIIGGIIGTGTIIAVIVGLILITLQVTKPVLQLTQAAENISLGRFDTRLEVNVKNELGILAAAIDRMRESLKTCIERLKVQQENRF